MKTLDEKTHDDKTRDESISDVASDLDALALLAAAGIEAALVFDGDADRCPLCRSQVLAQAA